MKGTPFYQRWALCQVHTPRTGSPQWSTSCRPETSTRHNLSYRCWPDCRSVTQPGRNVHLSMLSSLAHPRTAPRASDRAESQGCICHKRSRRGRTTGRSAPRKASSAWRPSLFRETAPIRSSGKLLHRANTDRHISRICPKQSSARFLAGKEGTFGQLRCRFLSRPSLFHHR